MERPNEQDAELTPEQVRLVWDIAEALTTQYADEHKVSDAEAHSALFEVYEGYCMYPKWTTDPGAAYTLCLDVLDRLNARAEHAAPWRIEITAEYFALGHYVSHKNGMTWEHFSADGRDALSMARVSLDGLLALAALEGGAQ